MEELKNSIKKNKIAKTLTKIAATGLTLGMLATGAGCGNQKPVVVTDELGYTVTDASGNAVTSMVTKPSPTTTTTAKEFKPWNRPSVLFSDTYVHNEELLNWEVITYENSEKLQEIVDNNLLQQLYIEMTMSGGTRDLIPLGYFERASRNEIAWKAESVFSHKPLFGDDFFKTKSFAKTFMSKNFELLSKKADNFSSGFIDENWVNDSKDQEFSMFVFRDKSDMILYDKAVEVAKSIVQNVSKKVDNNEDEQTMAIALIDALKETADSKKGWTHTSTYTNRDRENYTAYDSLVDGFADGTGTTAAAMMLLKCAGIDCEMYDATTNYNTYDFKFLIKVNTADGNPFYIDAIQAVINEDTTNTEDYFSSSIDELLEDKSATK